MSKDISSEGLWCGSLSSGTKRSGASVGSTLDVMELQKLIKEEKNLKRYARRFLPDDTLQQTG
jgi:hypothetical protein